MPNLCTFKSRNPSSRSWNPESGRPAGSIPSENELSHIYGVSRTTVRNVITKLVQEGLLFRIPGKGTYVAEPKIVAHSLTYAGIREQLEQMGYEVSTRLISMGLETVDQKIMEHFPGLDDPHFYVVRRLRMLKGEPLSIHISYLPHAYCPGIDQYDLSSEQLCTVLSRVYDLNRAKAVETLESVAANSTEASLLNIFPGQPLLLLQDRILDASGRTFEYSKVVFRGEKIEDHHGDLTPRLTEYSKKHPSFRMDAFFVAGGGHPSGVSSSCLFCSPAAPC